MNPSKAIVTDCMTGEESQFECADRVKKAEHYQEKYKAAGFTQAQIDKGDELWELVKPAFRSAKVS